MIHYTTKKELETKKHTGKWSPILQELRERKSWKQQTFIILLWSRKLMKELCFRSPDYIVWFSVTLFHFTAWKICHANKISPFFLCFLWEQTWSMKKQKRHIQEYSWTRATKDGEVAWHYGNYPITIQHQRWKETDFHVPKSRKSVCLF